MNRTKLITRCLGMIAMLVLLAGCNDEDDVMSIFTGRTWKLSFISAENSIVQYDFWNGDNAKREQSMKGLAQESSYQLDFEGVEQNGTAGGSFKGQALTATVEGKWNANASNGELTLTDVKTGRNETDALAAAFVLGLKNAYKYEGDENNLFIYYDIKGVHMKIGLKPKK